MNQRASLDLSHNLRLLSFYGVANLARVLICFLIIFSFVLPAESFAAKKNHHPKKALIAKKKHKLKKKIAVKRKIVKAPLSPIIPDKYSAIVVDYNSGKVIYAKNPDSPRYPASLTKIMTLYLAFEALDNGTLHLYDHLPVSAHAANQAPSRLGLKAGETITVEQAILGIVTKSANDAATVLAEGIGGNEQNFSLLMTQRAQSLGMYHTHFYNASGLPNPHQTTTASDLAKLSLAMLRHFPHYYHYFQTRHFNFDGRRYNNHNHLLNEYEGLDGIKTGYINASGFNLSASAVREGKRLIAIVFGGRTANSRDQHVAELLNQGFQKLGVK